jgi:hypothetical protein
LEENDGRFAASEPIARSIRQPLLLVVCLQQNKNRGLSKIFSLTKGVSQSINHDHRRPIIEGIKAPKLSEFKE